jgi:hypothetical protein
MKGKKGTIEEFIKRANEVHNFRYDYSKSVYKGCSNKIEIICPVHGSFFQMVKSHLHGRMCFTCGVDKRSKTKTGTTEGFIKKAIERHGQVYDYSQVIFKKAIKKIKIICSKHGIFRQTPNRHLQGQGCPKCGAEKRRLKSQLSTDEFIKRSQKIHKNKYNYDKSIYRGWETKINIKCLIHGIFEQRAGDHLMGEGCSKCGRMGNKIFEKIPLDEFISRSNDRHNNKYDYSRAVYKNNRSKVVVSCRLHGDFFVTPDNHLKGSGCTKCRQEGRFREYQIKFIERATVKHSGFYDYSRSVFHGHKKKIKIICPKHGSFFQTPDRHLRGGGCSRCILKQEHELEKILTDKFIGWEIKRHKRIFSREHCRYRSFDFLISRKSDRLIVEYDGKQHFEPVRFSKKMTVEHATEKFLKQKITDELDQKFCARTGIKLFRVSYKENMSEAVKKIANHFLESE